MELCIDRSCDVQLRVHGKLACRLRRDASTTDRKSWATGMPTPSVYTSFSRRHGKDRSPRAPDSGRYQPKDYGHSVSKSDIGIKLTVTKHSRSCSRITITILPLVMAPHTSILPHIEYVQTLCSHHVVHFCSAPSEPQSAVQHSVSCMSCKSNVCRVRQRVGRIFWGWVPMFARRQFSDSLPRIAVIWKIANITNTLQFTIEPKKPRLPHTYVLGFVSRSYYCSDISAVLRIRIQNAIRC